MTNTSEIFKNNLCANLHVPDSFCDVFFTDFGNTKHQWNISLLKRTMDGRKVCVEFAFNFINYFSDGRNKEVFESELATIQLFNSSPPFVHV